ncbi:DUF52 domain containing protein [Niveomyces insectorum RCEF 264]|uniref:DUF52 domain containing protein n=1 Tax=Niveomyces insectorum RCEF 264 TaxID=1081102 RepID=A0A167VAK5_9HYPO|nr:DUF52 domain containing protein [Niveomyces insectorum RCEF 264]
MLRNEDCGVVTSTDRSWYTSNPEALSAELDEWLDDVPTAVDGHRLPIPGARAIIAPHAGYRYSGPCAAWAYKSLDLSKAKRVFLLGPSHTYYLRGCALTTFEKYATPFGDFQVDADVVGELRATGKFKDIPRQNDVREHSLEMHLPYIWKSLERKAVDGASAWPTLVPIMVGDGDAAAERDYGTLLMPYLEDPTTVFVRLAAETRRALDQAAFRAIETGSHDEFVQYLHLTENTICGRHPIGVTMAALELLAAKAKTGNTGTRSQHTFVFVRYERSELAQTTADSSVSYGSAYATI